MDIQSIIQAGCHFGSLKKDSHPKTKEYWLGIHNNVVVINPEIMAQRLSLLSSKIADLKKAKKDILIVWTKSLYSDRVAEVSKKAGCHYLDYKVLGGFLTNFDTLIGRIKSMNKMKAFIESEDFSKITKKEQLATKREYIKVQKIYQGVANLSKKPDFVIVFDGALMQWFVREIKKSSIDNLVVASTDFKYWWPDDKLLVANTNSFSSVDFVLKTIL